MVMELRGQLPEPPSLGCCSPPATGEIEQLAHEHCHAHGKLLFPSVSETKCSSGHDLNKTNYAILKAT